MVQFQCKGYITRVFHDKKIKIQIDEEDQERIGTILSALYKTKKESNILYILLSPRTIVDIQGISYTKLEDLIGVYVYIRCFSKYYQFEKKEETETQVFRGYTMYATHVRNYVI